METKQLQVELKKGRGSRLARKHRSSGLIPAVLYGHKQENITFLLNKKEFDTTLDSGIKMVNLNWNNSDEIALIKDVQFDTFGREILHVDFVRVALTEKISTQVSVELYGISPGVKEGGILTHSMKSIEIECLPTDIPENIRINISVLNIGDTIHVKDLELPPNIKSLDNPDAIVISVHFATEEKEVLEEELIAEPEVISARKTEDGKEAEKND